MYMECRDCRGQGKTWGQIGRQGPLTYGRTGRVRSLGYTLSVIGSYWRVLSKKENYNLIKMLKYHWVLLYGGQE